MKYSGTNLMKYVKDLYEENYKTLMGKKIKELNKWQDIHESEDSILSRCQFFPPMIYRVNTTPAKRPGNYFVDLDKLIIKFI